MEDFFSALSQHAFLQTAVAAALLASIGCGVMGTYVVVKRIAFLAGGADHHPAGGRCLRGIGNLKTSPRPSPRPIGRCAAWVSGSAS
jgi:hypothetical protein